MAALKDIARNVADEIREGIGWVIVYRTGRAWHSLSLWSDVWNSEWEPDDLSDALGILKADPNAVVLNGYYCGHFGEDMTADQIAAGIRWHYENGYNRLADHAAVEQAQIDSSAREDLADVVATWAPGLPTEKADELAAAGASLHIDPEAMQRILEAFDQLTETVKRITAELVRIFRPIVDWAIKATERLVEALAAGIVPRKWLHLAKHAKKARTRKKYRNRIRRAVAAALAAEGGGSS